jgi:hypothetical protein
MNIEQYLIISDNSHLSYKFKSIGPKGIIQKIVFYRKLNTFNEDTYNLSFGDLDEINGDIDDQAISNNNDATKVLYTVALTVLLFVNHFPEANVLIVGSTNSRTRFYLMAISRNIIKIGTLFEILGFRNDHLEKFKPLLNYEAFLIKKKTNKSQFY